MTARGIFRFWFVERVCKHLFDEWARKPPRQTGGSPKSPRNPGRFINGRFRDECFNLHWFESLPDGRRRAATWRKHYHRARAHSGLGNLNPHQFHQVWAQAK